MDRRFVRRANSVAPYAGAWIETRSTTGGITSTSVAPYAGAWIETMVLENMAKSPMSPPTRGAWIETRFDMHTAAHTMSPPTRGRGLKLEIRAVVVPNRYVAPYPFTKLQKFLYGGVMLSDEHQHLPTKITLGLIHLIKLDFVDTFIWAGPFFYQPNECFLTKG